MAIKYIDIRYPVQRPPKFTQIGIFGLKINHLATLIFFRHEKVLRRTADSQIAACKNVDFQIATFKMLTSLTH
jgi:hypothetical protein